FSIKFKGPRVFGVGRTPPGTVLPYAIKVLEFEDGGLCIGNIRFAILLYIYTSRRTDLFGPIQCQHPTHRIEHVHAHIPHNAISVFHEGAPPSGMWRSVIGP